MTGPEHFQAAERCLSSVDDDSQMSLAILAEAQVHATLALAAATAMVGDMTAGEWPGWREAAGSVNTRGDAS